MQNILKKLDRFEDKVKELSQKIEYLRKENMMLIEENVKIKKEAERIKDNHQKGNGVEEALVNVNVEQCKKDLSKYIGEVENCIEIINSM
jgi:regulator of replication initiation timing